MFSLAVYPRKRIFVFVAAVVNENSAYYSNTKHRTAAAATTIVIIIYTCCRRPAAGYTKIPDCDSSTNMSAGFLQSRPPVTIYRRTTFPSCIKRVAAVPSLPSALLELKNFSNTVRKVPEGADNNVTFVTRHRLGHPVTTSAPKCVRVRRACVRVFWIRRRTDGRWPR